MPRRRAAPAAAAPIIYDAGALVAADRGDRQLWAEYAAAVDGRRLVVVPSPVLTQAWRGRQSQPLLAKMLNGCRVLSPDETVAKQAGALLGLSKTTDAVDAIVVATAIALRAAIVTSDVGDITKLADSADADFEISILPI